MTSTVLVPGGEPPENLANEQERTRVLAACSTAVRQVDIALGLVGAFVTGSHEDYVQARWTHWANYKFLQALSQIYGLERQMLQRLYKLVDPDTTPVLDAVTLQACSHIVSDADAAARKAKFDLPFHLGDELAPNDASAERKRFRPLARTHWKLIDYLQTAPDTIQKQLGSLTGMMIAALKEVDWVFVVFVSYAHEDMALLEDMIELCQDELDKRHVILWWDRKGIRGSNWWEKKLIWGADWQAELEAHIDLVDVGVVLISPSFFASSFIIETELPQLVAKRKQGLQLLPLVLEKSDWAAYPWLPQTQWLPNDDRTLRSNFASKEDLLKFCRDELTVQLDDVMKRISS
jgi:hypothetical protein